MKFLLKNSLILLPITFSFFAWALSRIPQQDDPLRHTQEKHLRNIRQLTFGGTNAEAYFSYNEQQLVFQSTRAPYNCDQIFTMNLDGSAQTRVSTGRGRTTCAYFLPGDKKILYASTHLGGDACPPPPDKSKGYVWGVFNAYDIFIADAEGSNLKVLTASPGYDAEATVSPAGDKIVFTSSRDGDLELYTMDLDGSNIKRVTRDVGYDGGANFSWDSRRIVYRAYHPQDSASTAEYRSLLVEELVKPTRMEIFICNADGSKRMQLTKNRAANFAPIFHPNNKKIIYSSNVYDPKGRNFQLFMMNDDGTGAEQITFGEGFDSFPMFTRDGKKLIFVSDRNAKSKYEFNVFIADWVD